MELYPCTGVVFQEGCCNRKGLIGQEALDRVNQLKERQVVSCSVSNFTGKDGEKCFMDFLPPLPK